MRRSYNISKLIALTPLCEQYQVEMTFFHNLGNIGLVEITTIEKTYYIHRDQLSDIEKILRLHRELDVNVEGIDIILNLLQKLKDKENELNVLKNRLRLYEN